MSKQEKIAAEAPVAPFTASVQSDALRRAVMFSARSVVRKATIPVLSMVRVSVDGGSLVVSGTDLDNETSDIAVCDESAGTGGAIIDPKLLLSLIRGVSGQIMIDSDAERIIIKTPAADGLVARMTPVAWPDDFPSSMLERMAGAEPAQSPPREVAVSAALLRRALATASVCVSTEENRYYLNGVFLQKSETGFNAVATDGHMLTCVKADGEWPFSDAILPTQACKHLLAMLEKATPDDVVYVMQASLKFRFKLGGRTLTCKTIDGTFPDYTRVIPAKADTGQISVSITGAACRRLPMLQDRVTAVTFNTLHRRMSVSLPGKMGDFSLPLQVNLSASQEFGFNLKYLQRLIPPGETVRIEGKGKDDPFVIVGQDENVTRVLMPMRV